MPKFTVIVHRMPTNFNDPFSLTVEAETEKDAKVVARYHVGDIGITNHTYQVIPYVAPPPGKVLT